MPDFNAASVCLPSNFIFSGRRPSRGAVTNSELIKTSTPFTHYAQSPIFPWAAIVPVEMVFFCINHFHALCTQLHWYSEKNATMTTATTDGI